MIHSPPALLITTYALVHGVSGLGAIAQSMTGIVRKHSFINNSTQALMIESIQRI
jgi:hypothetical protein